MSKDRTIVARPPHHPSDSSRADELEAKREAVRVGIADADAGRLIPFAEIKAWIRSWGSKDELPRPKPQNRSRT